MWDSFPVWKYPKPRAKDSAKKDGYRKSLRKIVMKNRFEELLRKIITSCGTARACLCGNFRNCGQENAPEKIITKTSYEVRGGESFWRGNFRNRGQEKAPRKIVTKKSSRNFIAKKKGKRYVLWDEDCISAEVFHELGRKKCVTHTEERLTRRAHRENANDRRGNSLDYEKASRLEVHTHVILLSVIW